MDNTALLKSVSFNLSSVAKCTVGSEWNYNDVISSFTRLFLVTEGEAWIYIGEKIIHLKPGYLYLIPSFVHCSYICKDEMSHYYATFTIQLPDNLSIYQLFDFNYEIRADKEHYDYFTKLWEANPNMALPAKDPKIYQRISSKQWNSSIKDAQRSLVSSGLLYLILSKFIGKAKIDFAQRDSGDILSTIRYIHANLNEDLTVSKLAIMCHISAGHFTRQFKQLTKLSPLNYINKQRIEKAQMLLNTTSLSCKDIADACGFKSNAYFCKVFRKYIGQSPTSYRNHHI